MTATRWVIDGQTLVFQCDTGGYRIVVTDACGDICWAFGQRGAGPGSFETAVGLTLVRPEFLGEPLPADGPDAAWLAVADYGNRRVQIFELNGTWVGTIDTDDAGLAGPPCALRWRAPFLDIEGVDGARARVHLGAALLAASVPPSAVLSMSRSHPTAGPH